MAIMQRSVIIFEPYVANHFNNIIHMSFQITWKKNLIGW